MKPTWLLDIEVYPNFFFIGVRDYRENTVLEFEVSEYVDDRQRIFDTFSKFNGFLVTFNGIHYDNVVINYIVKDYSKLKDLPAKEFLLKVKEFSNKVIDSDNNFDDIKYYKWFKKKWTDIDLFLYWSKMLRMSKKISLKSLGIQLGHPEVQELPYHHTKELTIEEIGVIKHYNIVNDIGILTTLFEKMKSQISQRHDAIEKFGFDKTCYSWDGVKLGLNILLKEYCIENNVDPESIKELRTEFPKEGIKIKDILLPDIKFRETEQKIFITIDKEGNTVYNCNTFYTLFEHIKRRTVYSTTDLYYSVIYNDVKYDIKSGGLHSWHKDEIVEPDLTKYLYEDIDVNSYYPSLGSEYGFVPVHLPGMDKVIRRLKVMRLQYKAEGNKKDAELYKLALNGGYYGNLNSSYSPMYDPLQLLSVTINGQLFLLMLSEWLEDAGISIDMCNTDGITAIIPIEKAELFKEIYNKWEKLTLMELEKVSYTKVVRKNINNYIAISTDDKIKRKGLFKFGEEVPLGDSIDEEVIARALTLYFVENIPIEESIRNPDKYNFHIYDYCKSNKISKDYEVIYNNNKVQNLNRYYFSQQGPYLFKKKKTKDTLEHVNVGKGIILFNKYEEKDWADYKINYNHYIAKAREIINGFENKQLTLF